MNSSDPLPIQSPNSTSPVLPVALSPSTSPTLLIPSTAPSPSTSLIVQTAAQLSSSSDFFQQNIIVISVSGAKRLFNFKKETDEMSLDTTDDLIGVGAGAFAGITSLPRSTSTGNTGGSLLKKDKGQRVGVIGQDALNAVFRDHESIRTSSLDKLKVPGKSSVDSLGHKAGRFDDPFKPTSTSKPNTEPDKYQGLYSKSPSNYMLMADPFATSAPYPSQPSKSIVQHSQSSVTERFNASEPSSFPSVKLSSQLPNALTSKDSRPPVLLNPLSHRPVHSIKNIPIIDLDMKPGNKFSETKHEKQSSFSSKDGVLPTTIMSLLTSPAGIELDNTEDDFEAQNILMDSHLMSGTQRISNVKANATTVNKNSTTTVENNYRLSNLTDTTPIRRRSTVGTVNTHGTMNSVVSDEFMSSYYFKRYTMDDGEVNIESLSTTETTTSLFFNGYEGVVSPGNSLGLTSIEGTSPVTLGTQLANSSNSRILSPTSGSLTDVSGFNMRKNRRRSSGDDYQYNHYSSKQSPRFPHFEAQHTASMYQQSNSTSNLHHKRMSTSSIPFGMSIERNESLLMDVKSPTFKIFKYDDSEVKNGPYVDTIEEESRNHSRSSYNTVEVFSDEEVIDHGPSFSSDLQGIRAVSESPEFLDRGKQVQHDVSPSNIPAKVGYNQQQIVRPRGKSDASIETFQSSEPSIYKFDSGTDYESEREFDADFEETSDDFGVLMNGRIGLMGVDLVRPGSIKQQTGKTGSGSRPSKGPEKVDRSDRGLSLLTGNFEPLNIEIPDDGELTPKMKSAELPPQPVANASLYSPTNRPVPPLSNPHIMQSISNPLQSSPYSQHTVIPQIQNKPPNVLPPTEVQRFQSPIVNMRPSFLKPPPPNRTPPLRLLQLNGINANGAPGENGPHKTGKILVNYQREPREVVDPVPRFPQKSLPKYDPLQVSEAYRKSLNRNSVETFETFESGDLKGNGVGSGGYSLDVGSNASGILSSLKLDGFE
ncbi:hypothetical protein HK098_004396 [Nowakowskiella sp. JEL0407]|nr:hypothetical protein HK098_004396 [Nowakowskiella sp. JEL0407]